ncbi:hypothetical protein Pelo_17156 [Pelomyxa schiedti]|nr:hypothetical protein Pelo_17156 [Pelomyxa schiedti]
MNICGGVGEWVAIGSGGQPCTGTSSKHCDYSDPVVIQIESPVMYKFRQYKMTVRVLTEWIRSSSMTTTQIANCILSRSSWMRYGSFDLAQCSRCCPDGSPPVTIKSVSVPDNPFGVASALPGDFTVFIFELTTHCTSSREHLRSHVVLIVHGLTGIPSCSSEPVALRSRTHIPSNNRSTNTHKKPKPNTTTQLHPSHSKSLQLHEQPPQNTCTQIINHNPPYPNMDMCIQPITSVNVCNSTFIRVPSNAYTPIFNESQVIAFSMNPRMQSLVDSRNIKQLPEATIAMIPERFTQRPVILIFFMAMTEETFQTLWNPLLVAYGPRVHVIPTQLAGCVYAITQIHKSIEDLLVALTVLRDFTTGKNPLTMDLTQPNKFIRFIGWSSNLITQTPPQQH